MRVPVVDIRIVWVAMPDLRMFMDVTVRPPRSTQTNLIATPTNAAAPRGQGYSAGVRPIGFRLRSRNNRAMVRPRPLPR